MNKSPFASQRFSVNSSLATLKNHQPARVETTASKRIQSKRFSYQDPQHYQNTYQKENFGNNANRNNYPVCLNHANEKALFSALENTSDPMYLCQRCAIMVASKGFQVSRLLQKMPKKLNFDSHSFKSQISATFNSIKMNKSQTFSKISENESKIQKKESEIEKYFMQLEGFLKGKKEESLKEIRQCRRELEIMKHEASNYYLMLLQKVKHISQQSVNMPQEVSSQFEHYLMELSKSTFKVASDKINDHRYLAPLSEIKEQISALIFGSYSKQIKAKGEFKTQCEKQNSSIKSLQLSFQEDADSRPQNGNSEMLKNGTQSISSNLLSSIDLF